MSSRSFRLKCNFPSCLWWCSTSYWSCIFIMYTLSTFIPLRCMDEDVDILLLLLCSFNYRLHSPQSHRKLHRLQWRRAGRTGGGLRGGNPPRAALCRWRHLEGQKYGILKFGRFWRISCFHCRTDSAASLV